MQPWATLWALGIKTHETRSWSTGYRGRLYIHASLKTDESGRYLWDADPMIQGERSRLLNPDEDIISYYQVQPGHSVAGYLFHSLPRGCVIGHIDIIDVMAITKLNLPTFSELEKKCGIFTDDGKRFAWAGINPVHYSHNQFIDAKGSLGIWDFDPDAQREQNRIIKEERKSKARIRRMIAQSKKRNAEQQSAYQSYIDLCPDDEGDGLDQLLSRPPRDSRRLVHRHTEIISKPARIIDPTKPVPMKFELE